MVGERNLKPLLAARAAVGTLRDHARPNQQHRLTAARKFQRPTEVFSRTANRVSSCCVVNVLATREVVRYLCAHQLREFFGWHRFVEIIALEFVAGMLPQKVDLLLRFDPLRCYSRAQYFIDTMT